MTSDAQGPDAPGESAEPLWLLHAWLLGSAVSLLLAAHGAYRLHALYLVPAGARGLGAVAAVSGAAAGLVAARWLSPFRHGAVPWVLFSTALAVGASSFAPFVAFDSGPWAAWVAGVCSFVTVATLTAAALTVHGAAVPAAAALGMVPFLLRPVRVPSALLGVLLVEVVLSRAGYLRSGPVLAVLVAAFGASYPTVHGLLHEGQWARTRTRAMRAAGAGVAALAVLALSLAPALVPVRELSRFPDEIVFAARSDVADYAVVASPGGYELFCDGQLAVSSLDEPRRTAALVAPALASATDARRVLLLNGGLGVVERDVLADAGVESLTVVSPDARRGVLSRRLAFLSTRAHGALDSSRVHTVVAEPLAWLAAGSDQRFGLIIADFPWPLGYREGKLYTRFAFARLAELLAVDGVVVVPGGSAFTAPEALADVTATLASVGLRAAPYHVAVPTVGVTSFVVASRRGLDPSRLGVAFPGIDLGTDLRVTQPGQIATLHVQTVVTAFDDARARR